MAMSLRRWSHHTTVHHLIKRVIYFNLAGFIPRVPHFSGCVVGLAGLGGFAGLEVSTAGYVFEAHAENYFRLCAKINMFLLKLRIRTLCLW